MPIMAPVGTWRPDTPDYAGNDTNAQDSLEALNVIARESSYAPFPSLASVSSNTLDARAQGAFFARKSDGSGVVIVGTVDKLYKWTGGAFSDITRLSGGYACPSDGVWSFSQFGSKVYASNGTDNMQKYDLDLDSNFSDNTGSPPVAKYQAVAGDFLFTGQQGASSASRQLLQWSSINDPTASWAASQATQANNQPLPDGGWIQGLVGQEYAVYALQEFAVRRGTYTGGATIWQFAKVTDNLGCSIPGTIASFRDLIFFYHRSGFYMLQGGTQITPIGEQRVNNWFASNLDFSNQTRVCCGIDPVNGLYAVAFPDLNNSGGNPNHILAYSWTVDRWTHIQPSSAVQFMWSAATQSITTIEQLAVLYATLELVPFPLDSTVWTGVGRPILGGFDTTNALGFFNGPNLQATMDTTEINLAGNGAYSFIASARPMVDGGTPQMKIGTRNRLEDAVSFGTAQTMDSRGRCHFRASARYHRGRIIVPSGSTWTHCQGVDNIKFRPEGGY